MSLGKLKKLLRTRPSEVLDDRYAVTTLAKADEKVALAQAKRDSGQQLSRAERLLLAAEDAGMTPEHQMKVLKDVSTAPERNSMAQVSAVNAAASLVGDDGKQGSHEITVNVAIGALWHLAAPDANGSEGVQGIPALGWTTDPTQVDG